MKNIIICSDGTGNSSIKNRGTNVFKVYESVDQTGHHTNPTLTPQVAVYDDGVGTESFLPLKLLGGAFGYGLSRNVKELYTALVRSYEPGDKIYLFGFSRGAFTVRTLCGFITSCGILDGAAYHTNDELAMAVTSAYRVYRSRYMTGIQQDFRKLFKKSYTEPFEKNRAKLELLKRHKPDNEPRVEFIGVWDTVDAVGLPIVFLADMINYFIYPFKFSNFKLDPKVNRACHALSIDDERQTFHPYMWDESGEAPERINQVWFAGVHSNVGGGYPKQGMSLVPLHWIMQEAGQSGLRFVQSDLDYYSEHQNVNDKMYNSRAGLAIYYRYKPRDMERICKKYDLQTAKIHDSVFDRIGLHTEGYAPGNLPRNAVSVATGAFTRYPRAGTFTKNLLKEVKFQVWIRHWSHYGFVIFTLLVLVNIVQKVTADQPDLLAKLKKLMSVNIMSAVLKEFFTNPMLFVLILVFFLIGAAAEKSMKRRFSIYWNNKKVV